MTITLHLDAETEKRLAARAAAEGKSQEAVAEEFVRSGCETLGGVDRRVAEEIRTLLGGRTFRTEQLDKRFAYEDE